MKNEKAGLMFPVTSITPKGPNLEGLIAENSQFTIT